jgi:hypothetical protein
MGPVKAGLLIVAKFGAILGVRDKIGDVKRSWYRV